MRWASDYKAATLRYRGFFDSWKPVPDLRTHLPDKDEMERLQNDCLNLLESEAIRPGEYVDDSATQAYRRVSERLNELSDSLNADVVRSQLAEFTETLQRLQMLRRLMLDGSALQMFGREKIAPFFLSDLTQCVQ